MEKLITTMAVCDAEVTKRYSPAVLYTVEETVREAKNASEAGAAVIHVHVREDNGTPTQDRERPRVVLDTVKETRPGVILIPSTGSVVGMTAEERLQPTELFSEMTILDCGTCDFGDDVLINDMPVMRAFGKRIMENHIEPEYEYFEIGHLDTAMNIASKGEVPGVSMQFNFVLGVSGCTLAAAGNLDYLIRQIPASSIRTVTGAGRGAQPMVAVGIVMGGDVRVGFEDNIYLKKGHKATFNDELMEKVVRLAKELGREIVIPGEVRKILSPA